MDGRAFLATHPAIDAHADTLERFMKDPEGFFEDTASGHFSSRRMRATGQNVQVMAVYTRPDRQDLLALQDALDMIHAFHAIIESPVNAALRPPYIPVMDRTSLLAACRPGASGLALFLEGASPLRGSLRNLDLFFRLGVRGITITHNHDNEAASGCFAEGPGRGLTGFGRELLQAMEERGMIVDVAHANERTLRDVLSFARGPVVDSHTGLRAFLGAAHPRLRARDLSDESLRAIAASGGVACIDYLPDHLVDRGDPPRDVTLDDLASVIGHAVEVAGIDHVGLGSDWDGFGGAAVQGLEDASKLPALVGRLLECGISEDGVAKIVGGNLLRAFSEALPS